MTEAELKRIETIERQLIAIANSLTRHVYPRLDRIETELQIDEPVEQQ